MLSKIDVVREKGVMSVQWQDESRQEVRLDDLRRLCPCAVCEGNRMQESSDDLHMIGSDQLNASSVVAEVIPVGRYAIQIRWEDGHDTGIYTYEFIRSLGTVF
jgi:DUF971 family protein